MQRNSEKTTWNLSRTGKVNLTDVEQGIVWTTVGILILLILIGITYSVVSYTQVNTNLSSYTFQGLAIILGFAIFIGGFLLGIYTLPASCPNVNGTTQT